MTDAAFLDAFGELASLGVGKAAEVLNAMLGSHIRLSAPVVRFVDARTENFAPAGAEGGPIAAVEMSYSGSVKGSVELVFAAGDAGRLVDCLVGEETVAEEGLDSVRSGTLCEIGNIVINAIMGTLSNELGFALSYSVPFYREGAAAFPAEPQVVLLVETDFEVEALSIAGTIVLYFTLESFDRLRAAAAAYAGDFA